MEILLSLFDDRKQIPNSIAALYSEVVDVLLNRWDISRGIKNTNINLGTKEIIIWLSKLALKLLTSKKYWLTEQEIIDELCQQTKLSRNESHNILNWIRERSGLIVETGPNKYQFAHRSIQDYLAAKEIARSKQFVNILQSLTDEDKRNILRLLAEILPNPSNLISELLNRNDHDSALLLFEDLKKSSSLDDNVIIEINSLLNQVKNPNELKANKPN